MVISEMLLPVSETFSSRPFTEFRSGEGGVLSYLVRSGIFNSVEIESPDGLDYILGRVLREKSMQHRGIDMSKLMVLDPRGGEDYEFAPSLPTGIINLEDPRHFNGTIGVTGVHGMRGDYAITSPVLVKPVFEDGKLVASAMRVLTHPDGSQLQARNITPIAVETNENGEEEVTILARLEDNKHDQILSRFRAKGTIATHIEDTEFPVFPWNNKKIGTVGAPLLLDDGAELFFLHGQRELDAASDRREYSLGAARLFRGRVTHMTKEPILTHKQLPYAGELRDENIALYSTDNPRRVGRNVRLLANRGDLHTVAAFIPYQNIEDLLVAA